jgi:hypothetical protein
LGCKIPGVEIASFWKDSEILRKDGSDVEVDYFDLLRFNQGWQKLYKHNLQSSSSHRISQF